MKSVPKMAGAALRLGAAKANVAKIFGDAAVSRAQGEQGRDNGSPRAISDRGETQILEVARKLQDKGDLGEVPAEAIYRMWKGETSSLMSTRKWISRNFTCSRPSLKGRPKACGVSERGTFSADAPVLGRASGASSFS